MKFYLKEVDGFLELWLDNDTFDSRTGEVTESLLIRTEKYCDTTRHILQSTKNTLNFLTGVEEKQAHWRPKYKGNNS